MCPCHVEPDGRMDTKGLNGLGAEMRSASVAHVMSRSAPVVSSRPALDNPLAMYFYLSIPKTLMPLRA